MCLVSLESRHVYGVGQCHQHKVALIAVIDVVTNHLRDVHHILFVCMLRLLQC